MKATATTTATLVTALFFTALSVLSLAACGGDGGGGAEASVSPRPSLPDTASFTGAAPSAMASLAESLKASASAAASSAAASASARASQFEASVSAEVARANAAAEKELKNVDGQGNAMADVSLTGKPRAQTGGLLALVVNITNRTDKAASYAVQVDFRTAEGEVVETRYVGAEDLAPGKTAQPLAISRKPPEPQLIGEVAKAQRY